MGRELGRAMIAPQACHVRVTDSRIGEVARQFMDIIPLRLTPDEAARLLEGEATGGSVSRYTQ